MPKMWFARDGRRPDTQCGPGIEINLSEAQSILGSWEPKFVGSEAPSLNPDQPSESVKNVVIEIESHEGSSSDFPKTGFYLLVGMTPNMAETRLNEIRSQA